MKKCGVQGCFNNKRKNPKKYFFYAPRLESRRLLWMKATGRTLSTSTTFLVCEDHFDMKNDIDYTSLDGRPVLIPTVIPTQNLEKTGRSAERYRTATKICIVDQACQTDYKDSGMTQGIGTNHVDCNIQDSFDFETTQDTKRRKIDSSHSESVMKFNKPSIIPSLGSVETDEDEQNEFDEYDEYDNYDEEATESDFSAYEKNQICELTVKMMETDLLHYTGISKESSHIVNLIIENSGVCKPNVFLVLRKIRHNESFKTLGDLFGLPRQHAGHIFCTNVEKIAKSLQPFIYSPQTQTQSSYKTFDLPNQFKHKYKQVILQCFRINIAKPSKRLEHLLSWSKNSNAIKYLIGSIADGLIIFISKGFLGRITDNEILRRSGFLDFMKNYTNDASDQELKDINLDFCLKGGVLLNGPSNITDASNDEVEKCCKSITVSKASFDGVIEKFMKFEFLKNHTSVINFKRALLIESSIVIVSAICNIQ